MSDQRPDPPELPRGMYWERHRVPSAWNKQGFPVLDLRKRRLFGLLGSKLVCRQAVGELLFEPDPILQDHIIEDAMHKIAERMQL